VRRPQAAFFGHPKLKPRIFGFEPAAGAYVQCAARFGAESRRKPLIIADRSFLALIAVFVADLGHGKQGRASLGVCDAIAIE
jgi:hypothetical protein